MKTTFKIPDGMVLSVGQQPVTELSANQPHTVDAVWALNAGDNLEALETLHMQDHPFERVFTSGKRYQILDVLPLRTPAVAVVIDDSGDENKIDAEFLQKFKIVRN